MLTILFCYFGLLNVSHGRQTCKTSKRAARAILDVDFTVPPETMFTQLKWMSILFMDTLKMLLL